MREPVFNETMQIGIVVADLDAAIRAYEDGYGIGPWNVFEVDPAMAKDVRVDGRPAEYRCRAATTMVGQVMWELIQPLDSESLFARFLAEKGGGVHHVAVATPSFDEAVAAGTATGKPLVLSGVFGGIDIAYLPTEDELGLPLEVYQRRSNAG
jgi:methylmalonyl-CoA/ethylmalonyl-CoA epimerase